jgi:hypothetical protein
MDIPLKHGGLENHLLNYRLPCIKLQDGIPQKIRIQHRLAKQRKGYNDHWDSIM